MSYRKLIEDSRINNEIQERLCDQKIRELQTQCDELIRTKHLERKQAEECQRALFIKALRDETVTLQEILAMIEISSEFVYFPYSCHFQQDILPYREKILRAISMTKSSFLMRRTWDVCRSEYYYLEPEPILWFLQYFDSRHVRRFFPHTDDSEFMTLVETCSGLVVLLYGKVGLGKDMMRQLRTFLIH